jgi:hypothetical protein
MNRRRFGFGGFIVSVACLAVASHVWAFTPDDSFEFNSADDVCFDPDCGTKDAAVTENDVAYPLSTETDNLVTYDPGEGEDGAVMVHNTDAKRKVRFESPSGAWTLTAGGGFTMEIRAKFDRSMTTVPFNSDKGVEFVVRTADNKTIILFLGDDVGPDVVGNEPDWNSTEKAADPDGEFGVHSWEPDTGGTLIERTSDWHVYRIVYDPAKEATETEVELYVDGTLIIENRARPKIETNFRWGTQDSDSPAVVAWWVDYIRWADNVIERPGSGTLNEGVAIGNRGFDNISDPDGDIGAIPADPVSWQIQNISGPGAFPLEHTGWARCDTYAKSFRLQEGQAYNAVVKQAFTATPDQQATFEAQMRAYTASCTQIQGRVGIDPAGGGCDPASPSIVWSDWADLYDIGLCTPMSCVTLSTVATMTSAEGCVFIETNAPSSPGDEQSTFMDNAVLELVNVCNEPPQDVDGDGDADLSDYGDFLNCYNGPGNPWPNLPGNDVNCPCLDTDDDGDVDLTDYGVFLDCYNGPTNPPNC